MLKRGNLRYRCTLRPRAVYPNEVFGIGARRGSESSSTERDSANSNAMYLDPARTFTTGTACVESFFHEVLCELPGGHSSSALSAETFAMWSRAFFERRVVSTYARFAPRKFARGNKFESLAG